jgi:uncharacterized membrane protein
VVKVESEPIWAAANGSGASYVKVNQHVRIGGLRGQRTGRLVGGRYAGQGHMILAAVAAETSTETFTGLMDQVARGFEALGAAILVVGVIWSFVLAAVAWRRSGRSAKAYGVLRQAFGGTLLLGLEILVAADLVRTVAVAPTLDNVLVLGLIVMIRTFLSFSLETEIAGVAPWRRALISGAGSIRRASANALESETPP